MKYGVCILYGRGVTDVRETWLKRDGVIVEFDTPEEALAEAERLNARVRNTTASLSYQARER
jgi:hypothetical protein